jgi:hypothetical protein
MVAAEKREERGADDVGFQRARFGLKPVLNKWWIGMLEMLNGKNNQSISGTDRPVFLEAVVTRGA